MARTSDVSASLLTPRHHLDIPEAFRGIDADGAIDRRFAYVHHAVESRAAPGREALESRRMEIIALDVPQSDAYVKTEMERWAQAVKTSGAKAQ
jgi:hypothetical protein